MNKECQEPCCVEKRKVVIPLGVGHSIEEGNDVGFEVSYEGYNYKEKAKIFLKWLDNKVAGGFVEALRRELDND